MGAIQPIAVQGMDTVPNSSSTAGENLSGDVAELLLLAHKVGTKVTMLNSMIRRPLMDRSDMSVKRVRVLSHILINGPLRITQLASFEGVTQPTMTVMANGLVRDGFAKRTADDSDSRVVLLDLTPAGRDIVLEFRRARAVSLAENLATLSDEDLERVRDSIAGLDVLLDVLNDGRYNVDFWVKPPGSKGSQLEPELVLGPAGRPQPVS